jgi:tetratricopeptide (TPR) repeat protein
MPSALTGYRIFIATPGGLEEERRSFRQVISDYNELDALRRGVTFLPVGWEATLGGVGRPQGLITKDLRECDYLVLILWDRWGSPTGRVPEEGYTSGTEEEYTEALRCLAQADCPLRQIIVFFKAVDERKLSDPGDQLKKVLEFKAKLEREKTLLFYTYDEVPVFENKLRSHLAQWVRDHEEGLPDKSTLPTTTPTTDVGKEAAPAVAASEGGRGETQGSSELVRAAKELAFEHHYTEAETLFARAVAINNDLGALVSYGTFLAQRERLAQARAKFQRVVDLADEPHEAVWKARALDGLGDLLQAQGSMEEAEAKYKEGLEIFEEIKDEAGMAEVYGKLGDLYKDGGRLEQAEAVYHQSLKIYERMDRKEGLADIYSNLGNVCQARNDFGKAEEMHRRSMEIKEELGIEEGLADVYLNLGSIYHSRGDFDQTEQMYRQSLGLFEKLNERQGEADVLHSLGDLFREKEDFGQAEEYYRRSLEVLSKIGNDQARADVYNELGRVYAARRSVADAEAAYRLSLEIFERLDDRPGMADVYSSLSELYDLIGNAEQAKAMRQKSIELGG